MLLTQEELKSPIIRTTPQKKGFWVSYWSRGSEEYWTVKKAKQELIRLNLVKNPDGNSASAMIFMLRKGLKKCLEIVE